MARESTDNGRLRVDSPAATVLWRSDRSWPEYRGRLHRSWPSPPRCSSYRWAAPVITSNLSRKMHHKHLLGITSICGDCVRTYRKVRRLLHLPDVCRDKGHPRFQRAEQVSEDRTGHVVATILFGPATQQHRESGLESSIQCQCIPLRGLRAVEQWGRSH